MKKAVEAVNGEIRTALTGFEASDQRGLDQRLRDLDGTENKKRLGANAILGVSLAAAKAEALSQACRSTAMSAARSQAASRPDDEHHQWRRACRQSYRFPGVHDRAGRRVKHRRSRAHGRRSVPCAQACAEGRRSHHHRRRRGRLRPQSASTREALDFVMAAIAVAGYQPGEDVYLALDVAATEFYGEDRYFLKGEKRSLTADQMTAYYAELVASYPIFSIEDGMSEDDWEGWSVLTEALGDHCQLVGDDLFVTNVTRLKQGIDQGIANAILVKVNQIGTLTETLDAVRMAQDAATRR